MYFNKRCLILVLELKVIIVLEKQVILVLEQQVILVLELEFILVLELEQSSSGSASNATQSPMLN